MLMEFLESRLDKVKMSYESSKDTVVMFVGGNFNEENIRKKLMEGIGAFKQLTVEVVNRGLKIRVDRQSLMQNYDQFSTQLL